MQGQFASGEYVIFQCKPCSAVDETSNQTDVMVELKLLVHGQYFAKSFAQCMQTYNVQILGKPS